MRKKLLGGKRLIPISLSIEIKELELPKIVLKAREKTLVHYLKTPAVKAIKYPLTADELKDNLRKFESDIFYLENLDLKTDNSFIPKSELTEFKKKLDSILLDDLVPVSQER